MIDDGRIWMGLGLALIGLGGAARERYAGSSARRSPAKKSISRCSWGGRAGVDVLEVDGDRAQITFHDPSEGRVTRWVETVELESCRPPLLR